MAKIEDTNAHMMPAHFGGMPPPTEASIYDDTSALTVFYESDEAGLADLLPEGFNLARPEVMVSMMENRGVRWMGREPYNIVAVNVAATHERFEDEGWFCLVVWENKATPILPGREQTGIPKIYGEVEAIRRFPDASARTWSHYGGHTHCELAATDIRDASTEEEQAIRDGFGSMDWFGYRYIPKTAQAGAELAQATSFPQEFKISSVEVGTPELTWTPPPLYKNATQFHIIATMAALPIKRFTRPAILMDAAAHLLGHKARVL